MTTSAIKVDIHETAHAFRLNGVTFSKRCLAELFPIWGATDESFYRFLVIMPFFAETKEIGDAPTKVGNYAIAKSKRLLESLKLPHDAIPAFMAMAAQLGNLDEEDAGDIALQCHDAICKCGKKKSPVAARTLH